MDPIKFAHYNSIEIRMKNIIFLILFLTISIFTSCATCEERPDTYSYLNEFDKSILHFKSDAELKYLKNNSEEITFKIPKTVNEFYNLREGDDEICYADLCETEVNEIDIPNTEFQIIYSIRNQMGSFFHNIYIYNINNYDDTINYTFLNQNNNTAPKSYNKNTSFFEPYLQDITINNKEYKNVIVYVDINNASNYLILKPTEGLIYFDFKNDSYELIP